MPYDCSQHNLQFMSHKNINIGAWFLNQELAKAKIIKRGFGINIYKFISLINSSLIKLKRTLKNIV